MSKYKVSEPSALKFLKANGAVINENGNVVNDATDYWKKVYDQAEPKVAKYLHANGTIDENPGSGAGANLEDNKEIEITENGEIEITPSAGKDGMKKVTATVNIAKEVVLSVPVLPDGFTIEKSDPPGGSLVIKSSTAFSYFSVVPTGTYKNGDLDVTRGNLGDVDRNAYICIFRDSNYNTLIGMGRWRDYEALTN